MQVLETCLYSADLDAAERFYVGVVGLELHSRDHDRHVFLRCGGSMVLIFNPARTEAAAGSVGGIAVPTHGAVGPGHFAFSVAVNELSAWRGKFIAAGVAIEAEIAWPNGGSSIYVRDPAGNSVEVVGGDIWQIAARTEVKGD